MRPGIVHALEVNPRLPAQLARLTELAADLWYSWNRPARELFARVHAQLWDAVGHNPTLFLRYVDESRLVQAAQDPGFMAFFHKVFAEYDGYRNDRTLRGDPEFARVGGPVAYFCAEFGLHESLPIYSGGLGILAGDHCKTASDLRLPLVGVGLLYRQGYFAQTLDRDGGQVVTYSDTHFTQLPLTLVMRDGQELRVSVDLPGRSVSLRIWQARAGHVDLYFLDADMPPNSGEDRGITYRLYGGDRTIRLEQEIVLGIGGARALNALGIRPSVWHMNEGHAAFLVVERARELTAAGTAFAAAMESVAGNTVFTTHTAVPAGHDHFDAATIERYFSGYCRDAGIDLQQLLALGSSTNGSSFNMTALAVRGSRFRNGVSRIHGQVTSRMLHDFWPQVLPDDNPIDYVTNGVHVPTFLAPEWSTEFDRILGAGWGDRLHDRECTDRLLDLPDEVVWRVHQELKAQMLYLVHNRVSAMHYRNQGSESRLKRLLRYVDPHDPGVLTIGFARRFATYKRAGLVLTDLEWLRKILIAAERPVLFIFAGKAHPADIPGQEIIREVARIARLPEFEGRILFVEGYDLHLARRLVSGVDVWLNNPVYPLEASGTSGMKAGINGVLNLSVLDGWWDEGYEPGNGWAIKPVARELDEATRDREEASELYQLLNDQVIPLYYARGERGYSPAWVSMARRSIATLLPRFSATRMVREYASKLYLPAARQGMRYAASGNAAAQLAEWKARVLAAWPHVSVTRPVTPVADRMLFGDSLRLEVDVNLAGLAPDDMRVEVLLDRSVREGVAMDEQSARFTPSGRPQHDVQRYSVAVAPEFCGHLYYFIRVYPSHPLLTHPFELGLTIWA